jgi:hypothetical protein
MFCHNTTRNTDHKSGDCPILKKLGFKLEKRSDLDNANAALRVTAPPAPDSAKPAPASAPPLDNTSGSASLPGNFSALAETDSLDSGDDYNYEEKSTGLMYLGTSSGKTNTPSHAYLSLSCNCASSNTNPLNNSFATPEIGGTLSNNTPPNDPSSTQVMGGHLPVHDHSLSRSSPDPQGVKTIYLPKTVLSLLQNPTHPKSNRKRSGFGTTLLVADTGATNHMLPDKSAFIPYYPIVGWQVRMGNYSFAPILGHGTTIISLNGKKILI